MARSQNGKKGSRTTTRRVVYKELASLQSESPEELMKKMGGVSVQSGHLHTQQMNPMTASSLPVMGAGEAGHGIAQIEHSHSGLGSSESGGQDWDAEARQDEQIAEILDSQGHSGHALKYWLDAAKDFHFVDENEQAAQAYQNAATDAGTINSAWQTAFQSMSQAESYLASNNYNDAAKAFKEAAQQFSSAPAVGSYTGVEFAAHAYDMAGAYYDLGGHDTKAAAAWMDAAHLYTNGDPYWAAHPEEAQSGAHQAYMRAAELYSSAAQESTDHNQAASDYLNAAVAFANAGHPNQSNDAYIEAGNQYNIVAQQDEGQYEKAALAYSNAANAFLQAGDNKGAATAYENAGSNYTDANDLSKAASAFNNAGLQYADAGEKSKASGAFQNAAQAELNYAQLGTVSATEATTLLGNALNMVREAGAYAANNTDRANIYSNASDWFAEANDTFAGMPGYDNKGDSTSPAAIANQYSNLTEKWAEHDSGSGTT